MSDAAFDALVSNLMGAAQSPPDLALPSHIHTIRKPADHEPAQPKQQKRRAKARKQRRPYVTKATRALRTVPPPGAAPGAA